MKPEETKWFRAVKGKRALKDEYLAACEELTKLQAELKRFRERKNVLGSRLRGQGPRSALEVREDRRWRCWIAFQIQALYRDLGTYTAVGRALGRSPMCIHGWCYRSWRFESMGMSPPDCRELDVRFIPRRLRPLAGKLGFG